jgi:hypothetical protein
MRALINVVTLIDSPFGMFSLALLFLARIAARAPAYLLPLVILPKALASLLCLYIRTQRVGILNLF